MGSFFTKLSIFMYPRPNTRILMLGLDAALKTTILYKLKLGKVVSSIPTIGFNFEEIEYKNIKCSVWDVGGQTKMRALWKFYYLYSQGLIFVVDSCDRERIELAKEVLHELMREEELRDAVVLVFANKQDMGVMNVEEVAEKLGLHSLTERKWHIQGTCAVTGDGLYQGLDWLMKAIQKK